MPSKRNPALHPYFGIFLLGGMAVTTLRLALYLRPSPFGTPYIEGITGELPAALLLGWHGIALVSLPFFLVAFLTRPSGRRLSMACLLHIAIVFGSLIVGHADNEVHRFMGIPLSINYLKTYGNIGKTPESIAHALADDSGGAFSGYLLLVIPALFVGASLFICLRRSKTRRVGWFHKKRTLAGGLLILYMIPLFLYFGSGLAPAAAERIRPPIFLVLHELQQVVVSRPPTQISAGDIRFYRNWWQKNDHRKQWEFGSPALPLRKRYVGPESTPGHPESTLGHPPPNIIVLQLETFRAQNMRLFNPQAKTVTTPFIDQLARDPKSAYWTRFYCNGLPTVHTFMALHTGLLPHSQKRVATAFTQVPLEGFPVLLRKENYHTSFFSGPDPEWDNEQFWLEKWYDMVVFEPTYRDKDRPLFRQAAQFLKKNGREIQPFLSVVVSITNHVPFRSPEPTFDPPENANMIQRLEHTMRYTDDVVREFYESLKNEDWFENTVLILTGDHGYDLGDRGVFIGHRNLRHESTWVPLVVHGRDPRLPRGEQSRVASHIDIAPTVMELARIRSDNSFMGHSLLDPDSPTGMALAVRNGSIAVETPTLSVYFPFGEEARVFSGEDPMQLNDIAIKNLDQIDRLLQTAKMLSKMADSCYETNRIAPD